MSVSLATRLRSLVGGIVTIFGESSWVLFAFFATAALVFGSLVKYIPGLADLFDTTLGKLLAGGLIYALVVLVVVAPVWVKRGRGYVASLLGISQKPTRSILWLPILAWIAYMATTIIVTLITAAVTQLDLNQTQDTGFEHLSQPLEYVLAFLALVVVPPIAEELLFRGYLFGRIREQHGFWITTAAVSAVFGFVHLQWNVGIDVAVLSVFLCYLRERTGSIWAGMVLHGIKNGFAYFFLFIAPLLGMHLS